MDILLHSDRIKQAIELGESQFREFKSSLEGPPGTKRPRDPRSIRKDIAETLVSFANADGGELLIGVEDDGSITGVPFKDETISELLKVASTSALGEPFSNLVARAIEIDSSPILYFRVDKSTDVIHQTNDGRCLQRRDRENLPVLFEVLRFERQEQLSRAYDRQFVDGAQVSDLDLDLVHVTSESVTRTSPERTLQYFGLAEFGMGMLRLRRAALLLFARDISRWHPRCQVRIIRVKGNELKSGVDYNALPDEIAVSNILSLLPAAWEKLRPHLVERVKFTTDARFEEKIMYPELACREALVNAITHRDYSVEGHGIEIIIFDDRMEIHSPGNLLSTISIDSLRKPQGRHESRNALVSRVLRELGEIREIGEGMRRIFSLMERADLVHPELRSEGGRFSIVLRHKSVFSDADQAWLDGFKTLGLTREERTIALLGRDGDLLSPQQIYERLALVDWDVYREIIERIQSKGVVYNAMTQEEKDKRAKSRKVSKRNIPRLKVRHPEELEGPIAELFASLANTRPSGPNEPVVIRDLLSSLPPGNIYRTNAAKFGKLLRTLGIIDEERRPTAALRRIYSQQSAISREQATGLTIVNPTTAFPNSESRVTSNKSNNLSEHQRLSPPRPKTGYVTSIIENQRFAWVQGEDGNRYFLHATEVESASIDWAEFCRLRETCIEFSPEPPLEGKSRPRAARIRIVRHSGQALDSSGATELSSK